VWNVTTAQFECCGTTNFTDWSVADLFPHDDHSVPSNSSSSSSSVLGNGRWSLSVPDSCCVELLDHAGCGWSVIGKAGSRLNNINTEARLIYSTRVPFILLVCIIIITTTTIMTMYIFIHIRSNNSLVLFRRIVTSCLNVPSYLLTYRTCKVFKRN